MPNDPKDTHAGTTQGDSGQYGKGEPDKSPQQPEVSAELINVINRVVSEREKRMEKKLLESSSSVAKATAQEVLAALRQEKEENLSVENNAGRGGQPTTADDVEAKIRQAQQASEKQLRLLQKQIEAQQKELETERNRRLEVEATQKEEEMLQLLRKEALGLNVPEDLLYLLESAVYYGKAKLLKRDEDGKPVCLRKSDYGDELIEDTIHNGLKTFLATKEGSVFLRPDIRSGVGVGPRSSGNHSSTRPSILEPAKNWDEAEQKLTDLFSGKLRI